MRKAINTEHLEGRVYEHDLVVKTVQNQKSENYGKEYISGTLNVAVDEEGLNVIPIHYTYVAPTTKAGRNNTFVNLKKIIDENKTWLEVGKDEAIKVKIDTNLALNDFYVQNDELVSLKTNEGGFVTIVNQICEEGLDRHKFTVDMFINSIRRIEGEDPEDTYVSLRGAIFNFRNDILPMDFVVRNPQGMDYFENLGVDPKHPIYTKIWGKINSTVAKIKKEDVSAFGEAAISYVEKKVKEWLVTGTSPNTYMFGDESVLTDADITQAMQNREVMLAEKKKNRDEYLANKNSNTSVGGFAGGTSSAPVNMTSSGGFNF